MIVRQAAIVAASASSASLPSGPFKQEPGQGTGLLAACQASQCGETRSPDLRVLAGGQVQECGRGLCGVTPGQGIDQLDLDLGSCGLDLVHNGGIDPWPPGADEAEASRLGGPILGGGDLCQQTYARGVPTLPRACTAARRTASSVLLTAWSTIGPGGSPRSAMARIS